jgi:hypothetical protein
MMPSNVPLSFAYDTRAWASHVGRAMLKVINGTRYSYEWRGDQPALLSFVRVQNVGWSFD